MGNTHNRSSMRGDVTPEQLTLTSDFLKTHVHWGTAQSTCPAMLWVLPTAPPWLKQYWDVSSTTHSNGAGETHTLLMIVGRK
ncbi:hypothetical protein ACOMHN_039939 [Nucella lapillus]